MSRPAAIGQGLGQTGRVPRAGLALEAQPGGGKGRVGALLRDLQARQHVEPVCGDRGTRLGHLAFPGRGTRPGRAPRRAAGGCARAWPSHRSARHRRGRGRKLIVMRSRNPPPPVGRPRSRAGSCAGTSQTIRISPRKCCLRARSLPSMRTLRGASGSGGKARPHGPRPAPASVARIFQPIASGRRMTSSAAARRKPRPGDRKDTAFHQVWSCPRRWGRKAPRGDRRGRAACACGCGKCERPRWATWGGHGVVFTQENVWEKPAFPGRNCRQFRPVTRASASRRRSRSGRRLPASGLVRPRRRT